ncbi:hypothetical protein DFR70_103344 [Nocardia tenerifensis]|uniref:TY-Chap N-terminal domain-containing protein n=1 Tax=Nocardia tenerifensis TaxID=228006 RepID=A0A318K9X5_9NOCA|nr:hypothetical protein [Nocardia tenerifensis]PXX66595.1 hypothetical protein DFR70_103344 [Nocardia tenerifensis]
MNGWDEFAAGLAEELAGLSAGAVVIIAESTPATEVARYAQFRQFDDMLTAELCGDRWLEEAVQADEAGNRLIADAGWRPPEFDHVGNWWHEWPWPMSSAEYGQVAAMVVTGLRDAYGIAEPAALAYRAWNENTGNSPIELPMLGLSPAN